MRLRTGNFANIMAAASALFSASVSAQEPPATPATQVNSTTANAPKSSPKKSDQIETVVVTANKRKEDANKVATSISVIRGDDLVAQHIVDYADITRSIPNISFSGGGGSGDAGDGPGLSNIEIRGVSSTAGSATVGIYQDDVSMTVANLYSMGSAEPKFFDLDRVEILRGPQGTLYGSSSMGGTLKFITNQPNLKTEETDIYSEVSSTRGGGTNYTANAVFNAPLIPDELAFRIGVETGHNSGYINQVSQTTGAVISSGINGEQDSVVRMSMKWAPTKNLIITPSVFYQQVSTGDTDVSYTQILSGGLPTGISLPNYETSKLTREPGSDQLLVPSLTVNYGMDIGDLTSVTSFFQRKFDRVQDGSFTNSIQLSSYIVNNPGLASAVEALPSAVTLNNQVRQFSEELRLASKPYDPSISPITWLAGGYVSDQHTSIVENDPINGVNATFNAFGVSPTDPTVLQNAIPQGFPNDNAFFGLYHFHNAQQAIFGEANYYFTPTFHATAGMRYLHAGADFESSQGLFYIGPTTTNNASTHESKATPKFALTWEVDPTDTLYASAAEGFRVGGANWAIPQGLCQLPAPTPLSYQSDSLWSYEVGDKSRFLNNRLAVNASVFYIDWKNMLQEIELPCSFDYNVNVGNAASYGAELEIKAKPTSHILIGLSAGLTHATLTNNAAASTVPGAVEGAAIPGVPKFNTALTGQYNFNVSGDVFGFMRGAAHWTGSSHGGFAELPNGQVNPDFQRPAYDTVDASAGLSWDKWELSLFVKNLLNNDMIIQRPIVQALLGQVYRVEPRIVGLSLSGKF
jgi:iron complex outermembrane receptor protein